MVEDCLRHDKRGIHRKCACPSATPTGTTGGSIRDRRGAVGYNSVERRWA